MKDRLLLLFSKICSPIQNNLSDNQHTRLRKSIAQRYFTWMKNENNTIFDFITATVANGWFEHRVDSHLALSISPFLLTNCRCTEALTSTCIRIRLKWNWVIAVPLICTFNHVNVIYFWWNSSNAADCHSHSVFYISKLYTINDVIHCIM